MKGEYVEPKPETPTSMFSKLHQTHPQQQQQQRQQQQQQQQQQQLPHPFSHPFHQVSPATPRECQQQTSEEDDSRSSGGPATTATLPTSLALKSKASSEGDGATIEVVRRPRGRPPGSKNKPKPPVFITRDPEPVMSPYILEVPSGSDVVEAITRFCRRKNMGLCVLTGSGAVANVTLRQPSPTPGATVTFHGRFDILSISATFFPGSTPLPVPNGLTISLAGPQGQVVGGQVAGSLVAAGTVFVIAASFNNPSYHRIPPEDDVHNSASGGAEGHSPPLSAGGESSHAPAETCGMSMYSCHLPSDVIWAPTPRQAQPPPPPF